MGRHETTAHHDRILRELSEERVAALVRISRTLESLIDQLHEQRERVARAADYDRARERAAYHELRQVAIRYRWYLEVQREAMGLRYHHRLDEFYQIPSLDAEPVSRNNSGRPID